VNTMDGSLQKYVAEHLELFKNLFDTYGLGEEAVS
jgi:hypothetical protein